MPDHHSFNKKSRECSSEQWTQIHTVRQWSLSSMVKPTDTEPIRCLCCCWYHYRMFRMPYMMSANWLQPRQRCRPPSNLVCRQSSWQCETAFSLLHMHICHCPIMRSLQEASQWTCAGQKQLSRDQMSRDIKTQWSKKWEGWEEYVDQSNLVYYA